MWNIIFYEKEDGTKPVEEFLDTLPSKHRAKAVWEMELLGESGVTLGKPYTSHISGKLWELRIKFASDISRVFYFVQSGKKIVLLHGFVKKSQRTPKSETSIAETYLSDFERREGK